MRPRSKFWLERDGRIVLSDWRVRFLEAIDRTGSISAAAEELHIPYRRLWAKLKEIETNLGVQLVVAQSGGVHGGGSALTQQARDLVRRYRQYREGLEQELERRFEAAFAGLNLPDSPDPP